MFRCYALTEKQFAQGEVKHEFYSSRSPAKQRLAIQNQIQTYTNKLGCAGTTSLTAFDTLDAAKQYAKDNYDYDSLDTHAILEIVLPLPEELKKKRGNTPYTINYTSKNCIVERIHHSS